MIMFSDELWDLEPPTIAPRSHLFHLEPIGIGTPYVESLTSYIARLADAHSVSVGTLITREINKNYLKKEIRNGSNCPNINRIYSQNHISSLNGTNSKISKLVRTLTELTLQDNLQFLTLLWWTEVFPVIKLLKPCFAWCPHCYQEWRSHSKVIYSPLLWSFQVVTVCPYHHQPLLTICPHCQQQFLPLWTKTRPGYCLKCNAWLGSKNSYFEANGSGQRDSQRWEIWVSHTLGELLEKAIWFCPPPPRDSIKNAIQAYTKQLTKGNISAFSRFLGINRYKFIRWHNGVSIPILSDLLKICYTLSTSLVDFLKVELNPRNLDNLALLYSQVTPPKRQSDVAHKKHHDKEVTIRAMEQALSEEPPPTLTHLAHRLGYKSYSPLVKLSSSLATEIKNRAADYATIKRQQKIRELLQEVINLQQYPPPSLREVGRCHHIALATFYRYGSDLCQIIVERYQDYRLLRRQEIIQQACNEVQKLVPVLYAQGINPTNKNIRQFMSKPSALWKKEVVEALSKARRSLQ
jgi:hypothetical protein